MKFNKTALHLAVEKNDFDIVKLLMEQNDINTNITDEICFQNYYRVF